MSETGAGAPATLADAIAAADGQLDGPVAATATVGREGGRDATQGHRYVLLSIASANYAVREAYVTELERVPKITPVPHVPAWVRGVTNLRGDILSVIDMRTFLGLDQSLSQSARMLVVRLLNEDFATGLIVDGVDRIVAVTPNQITPPESSLEGPLAPYLVGMCVVDERLVAVLDLDQLLRSAEIRQFEELAEEAGGGEIGSLALTNERDGAEGAL
jgi:purine-binding chemotaxis protein CheW